MLIPRIIPCLDIRDGRVVKGVRFAQLRDAGDPVELAAEYERQGADELVFLDISATTEGRRAALHTVAAVRRVLSIPLTVGGGVRSVEDASAMLDAGADKVGVNTAAVEREGLVSELADRFGSQCVVVAVDAAEREIAKGPDGQRANEVVTGDDVWGRWEVVVRSGKERTGIDVVCWVRRVVELGAGEILLTSFDRDGTRSGYDLAMLGAVGGAARVPVIASGGADSPGHMAEALRAGADAVLAASIFHDGQYTVGRVKRELAESGVVVRW